MKAAGTVWVVLLGVTAAWGQMGANTAFNPMNASLPGVHLEGVSVYSGYYSSGAPTGFEVPVSNAFLPGASAMAGVAATFGGSSSGEKSTSTWSYSPSYFNLFYGNNQFSNNGSLNHRLSVNATRKLWGKWTLSASVNGYLANLEQMFFNPSVFSSVASLPTNFDDLAAAMLAGKFTDAQLASLLTGAPLQASAQQGYLYGNRIFNAAATVGLSWAPSERTSVSMVAMGSRMQSVNGVGTIGGSSGGSGQTLLPQMTTAGVSVAWSYSLSPRTQIGVTASVNRIFSRIQQGYTSNGNFTIGRTMSRRWFVQGTGGVGKLNYSQQTYAAPAAVQYLYGGSLGFKTTTQTFLVSYNRTLGDVYGLGSGSTSSAMGAWNWRRPGSSWSLMADAGYQELNNLTFQNTRSWLGGAGIARSLGQHLFVSAQYMYFQLPANLKTVGVESSENGVSVGMTWSPSGYQSEPGNPSGSRNSTPSQRQ